jgi:hypothetical protein
LTVCLLKTDLQKLNLLGYSWTKSISVCTKFEVSTTVNTIFDVFGNITLCYREPGSSVGIATGYGLDGPGFSHRSISSLGPT